MQSVQESKQELEASIRYAENAISSAKATIESMEFRQEMAKKQHSESTGREEALNKLVKELEEANEKLAIDNYNLQNQVDDLRASAFEDAKTIEQLKSLLAAEERESEVLKDEVKNCLSSNSKLRMQIEEHRTNMALMTDELEKPTMPVIPKDVAIAIFREGIKQGVCDVCDELDNTNDIEINESEYCGDFEVSFSKYIELSDHLDLDWIRDKVGNYEELNVINALMGLCEAKEFECRIHGVDDKEEQVK